MHEIPEIHHKRWGYEKWLVNNEDYCAKMMYLMPNISCSTHFHKNKRETFTVLKGFIYVALQPRPNCMLPFEEEYKLWQEGQQREIYRVRKGESFTIEREQAHCFYTDNKMAVFLETSTHHDERDSYRLFPRK